MVHAVGAWVRPIDEIVHIARFNPNIWGCGPIDPGLY
jgi:hypothetical protein